MKYSIRRTGAYCSSSFLVVHFVATKLREKAEVLTFHTARQYSNRHVDYREGRPSRFGPLSRSTLLDEAVVAFYGSEFSSSV